MLTDERKKEIEEKAWEIRKKYSLLTANFDLVKFLTECELFEIQEREIDDDTTGLLFVNDEQLVPNSDSNRVIVVNKKLISESVYKQKRRFICAHEYGHFILHRESNSEFAMRDTSKKDSDKEKEAEYFAYCLLMPKVFLDFIFSDEEIQETIKKVKLGGTIIPVLIADLFNVTVNKAKNRLEELNYEY